MHQELSDEEVHALDVVSLVVVAGKGSQDGPESLVAFLTFVEELISRECPRQVILYLLD